MAKEGYLPFLKLFTHRTISQRRNLIGITIIKWSKFASPEIGHREVTFHLIEHTERKKHHLYIINMQNWITSWGRPHKGHPTKQLGLQPSRKSRTWKSRENERTDLESWRLNSHDNVMLSLILDWILFCCNWHYWDKRINVNLVWAFYGSNVTFLIMIIWLLIVLYKRMI